MNAAFTISGYHNALSNQRHRNNVLALQVISIAFPRTGRAERMAGCAQAGQIFSNAVAGAAPIERFILNITFSQTPGYFGSGQPRARSAGIWAVVLNTK